MIEVEHPIPFRHGRARPGHPRLSSLDATKTWMPGTSPGTTSLARVPTLRDSAFPRRDAPESCMKPSPSKQRAQGMPGDRCARSLACKIKYAYERSHHGHTGNTRHSLRNGLRLISCSPRRSGFLVTVACGIASANLTPASRRQDHTTSPSAAGALVRSAACVHRIPPRVRDDRDTPLCGVGRRESIKLFLPHSEAKYFCEWDWTAK
jgi:hypothetical protein